MMLAGTLARSRSRAMTARRSCGRKRGVAMSETRQSVPTYALEYKRRPGDRETRMCARRADAGTRNREEQP